MPAEKERAVEKSYMGRNTFPAVIFDELVSNTFKFCFYELCLKLYDVLQRRQNKKDPKKFSPERLKSWRDDGRVNSMSQKWKNAPQLEFWIIFKPFKWI